MSLPKLCRGLQAVGSSFFFLILLCFAVNAQPGFITLDCGLPKGEDYVDDDTRINFIPDGQYVDTGETKTVKVNKVGGKYLVRAGFIYGNYDELQRPPDFDFHVGVHARIPVLLSQSETYNQEVIAVANSDTIWVCLVNTGRGTPVVSTIQLRQLPDLSYTAANASRSLLRQRRYNYGAKTQLRYPIDKFDRIWLPFLETIQAINTTMAVKSFPEDKYLVPSQVMQTAITASNLVAPLILPAAYGLPTDTVYVLLHFAELQNLSRSNQSRIMDLFGLGSEIVSLTNYTALFLTAAHVKISNALVETSGAYHVAVRAANTSTLPPMLNALESFTIKKANELPTDIVDVQAIQNIKAGYKLQRNWQGDPCVPYDYTWIGVGCDYNDGTKDPRIVSLNLSSSGLTAEIPASIANLTALTTLDVSNNSIPITVTELLAKLPSLKLLNLSGNKIREVSADLCTNALAGKLSLRIEGLEAVCPKSPQPSPSPPLGKSRSTSFKLGFHVSGAVFVALLGLLVA
ncbi:senescence-induced receptor-like serine/threonine-protein kinase isoform X2 [Wolffia australiana]